MAVSLVVVTITHAHGQSPQANASSVAAAHKRLQAARDNLAKAVQRIEKDPPSTADLDAAHAAVEALKEAIDAGAENEPKDLEYAKAALAARKELRTRREYVDQRRANVHIHNHRRAIDSALATLEERARRTENKDASAKDFDDARAAVAAVKKIVDEGRPFAKQDEKFASCLTEVDATVARHEKAIDDRWALRAVDKHRALGRGEPSGAVGRDGRAREERERCEFRSSRQGTAAIVVRELVEKFQPQASRSQAFGQYVDEVKKTLIEVEVELQRRSLDSARAEVVRALKNVERRNATDEQFAELDTALTVLKKTLETVHKKDPAIAGAAADAKALLRDARARMAKRRVDVDIERQRAKVQETKRNTEAVVREIQQPSIGDEQLQAAEEAIGQLEAVLEQGAALTKKDRDYAQLDREVKNRITELKGRIAARRLALAVNAGRKQLNDANADAKSKIDAARKPEATDADVEAASRSVEAFTQAIEANAALEKQDRGYAAHAERARDELMRRIEALERARLERALRRQTGDAFAAGAAAVEAAGSTQDLRKQKEHYEKAISQFRSCEKDGASMVKENPTLARIPVLAEGQTRMPSEVMALCAERVKATEQLLRQAMALIAFEDGPKRAFETGKALLDKDKKSEALPQFGECISTGKIALYKYPELKERTFVVAGANTTITELIDQCINQRKALLPK